MKPCIEIHDLSHRYPDGTVSLSDVSLTIESDSRVALLGPNGAGKSTLMLHLNGVLMPQTGTISVNRTLLQSSTLGEIRSAVGLVFQDPDDQLFMNTVYDDVAFGPANTGLEKGEIGERVHAALHAVGLAETASKSGAHLSYGQKKRVALATVLSMRPSVLVLDEPTSNLDPRSRRRMIELLREVHSTMLVATHDMDLAWELCDQAVVLDCGRLVACGPAAEIMSDANLMLSHGLEVPASALHDRAPSSDVQSRP